MSSVGHRLVIGPGGSGTSHTIRTWLAELGQPDGVSVLEIRALPAVPVAPAVIDRLRGDDHDLVVVHDVQWLADAVVVDLVHAADATPMWASRRPWPMSDVTRSLDDVLTADRPATRLGPVTVDELAAAVASSTGRAAPSAYVDELHAVSAGWIGPAIDAIECGWAPAAPLGAELVDRLLRRVERAGSAASALLRVLSVDSRIEVGLADRIVADDESAADRVMAGEPERAAAAGGLLDLSARPVDLFVAAVAQDLTAAEMARVHDRLAAALVTVDRDRAVDHRVAGTGQFDAASGELVAAARREVSRNPGRALELAGRARSGGAGEAAVAAIEAEVHFRAGRPEAIEALGRAVGAFGSTSSLPGDLATATAIARLAVGIDLRSARWNRVAEQLDPVRDDVAGEIASTSDDPLLGHVGQLALVAVGRAPAPRPASSDPQPHPIATVVDGLTHVLAGRRADALRCLAEAVDDEAAGVGDDVVGVTAALVAGLSALASGELAAADAFVAAGLGAGVGGPGERTSLAALHRYIRLRRSRADPSADAGADDESLDVAWARDRLLDAAVSTAVARRSADPVRLRTAWAAAEPVLVRAHPSWLMLEPLSELLVTGARLGHVDRTAPVIATLHRQAGAVSSATMAGALAWTSLHLALALGDRDAMVAAAGELAEHADGSRHAAARALAAAEWCSLAAGEVDVGRVLAAADALVDVQEGWEAARLAGQAALDADDPVATRGLLERARAAAADPDVGTSGAASGADRLVELGLSEREADVARLVADGRTHREVGAELYISPKTVEHHVARIRQKLGATSRAELIAVVRAHS